MSSKEDKKPLIIYIDDDMDVLQVVSRILKEEGFNVMCTGDPDIFFEYFKLHDVDLAILDAQIPERSGYELSEEIRSKPGYPNIPIIFLSGHSSAGDKLQGFFSGGNEYLTKPVNKELLVSTIHKLLANPQ